MPITLVASSLTLNAMLRFQKIFRISITIARPPCWLNLGTGTGKVAEAKAEVKVVVGAVAGVTTDSR